MIVLRTTHSRIAEDLARHLSPQYFGQLPDEVLRAVLAHDVGWSDCDVQQIAETRLQSQIHRERHRC